MAKPQTREIHRRLRAVVDGKLDGMAVVSVVKEMGVSEGVADGHGESVGA